MLVCMLVSADDHHTYIHQAGDAPQLRIEKFPYPLARLRLRLRCKMHGRGYKHTCTFDIYPSV